MAPHQNDDPMHNLKVAFEPRTLDGHKIGMFFDDENGNMVIGDEMLTPDSSRFWPVEGYEPGHGQPSFDKQFARDWLTSHPDNDWTLPDDVVQKTIDKYLQCYKMITGEELA